MAAKTGESQILFPMDFSARCEYVAPFVRLWAREQGTQPVLLHAISLPQAPELEASGGLYEALRTDLERQATTKMDAFAAKHFKAVTVETVLADGDPGAAIIRCERERKPFMIMMPTHGYGPFRRFLTGSVTAKVLHDAACPVWTAAHGETSRVVVKAPRQILCAVDRVPAAVPLIRWAAKLAGQFGASLKLVHVVPAVDEDSQNRGEKAVRRYWKERATQELTPLLEAASQSEIVLRGGAIPDTLADAVRENGADLLVIGRGHMKKNLGRLRTHSMAIVVKSPCPVISV